LPFEKGVKIALGTDLAALDPSHFNADGENGRKLLSPSQLLSKRPLQMDQTLWVPRGRAADRLQLGMERSDALHVQRRSFDHLCTTSSGGYFHMV
jgi:hypothetical protein